MKARLAVAAGLIGAGALFFPGVAHADQYTTTPTVPPTSGGTTAPAVQGTGGVATQPAAVQAVQSSLPITGGDVAGLSVIGVGLLGAGIVLVKRNKARTA